MSEKFRPGYADAKGILIEGFDRNGLIAEGPTLPADGTAGYSPGGEFFVRGGGSATSRYYNIGTALSCQFVPGMAGTTAAVTAATLAVTAADSGKTYVLNRAAGIAVTLPAAAAGLVYRFLVLTTFTGAASIKSVSGADVMIGHALMGNNSDNTVVDWPAVAASTFDTIDMFGTSNSTGGIEGQEVEIRGMAANRWFVSIRGDAAGTEATPFQDTVA